MNSNLLRIHHHWTFDVRSAFAKAMAGQVFDVHLYKIVSSITFHTSPATYHHAILTYQGVFHLSQS